jgi:RHS repeat-associated protein
LKIFSQNRLISMTAPVWTQPAGGFLGGQTTLDAITLSFRYDGLSRRISKKVTTTRNGVVTSTMEGYLYDGWNPVMITKLDPAATSETVLTRKWSCLWRPDLTSSLYARSSWQKAGGVGGLAWLQTGAAQTLASDNNPSAPSLQGTCEIHIPMADHMGNIRNYIHARSTAVDDGSGTGSTYAMVNFTPSANFEYDAFGREVRANGTTVAAASTPPGLTAGTSYTDALPFHFSSKFTDPESGLNYYGYRYYDPKDGRWLGRDPIGEDGGKNLYGMAKNNLVDGSDYLGLCEPGSVVDSGVPSVSIKTLSDLDLLKDIEDAQKDALKNMSLALADAVATGGIASLADKVNDVTKVISVPTLNAYIEGRIKFKFTCCNSCGAAVEHEYDQAFGKPPDEALYYDIKQIVDLFNDLPSAIKDAAEDVVRICREGADK